MPALFRRRTILFPRTCPQTGDQYIPLAFSSQEKPQWAQTRLIREYLQPLPTFEKDNHTDSDEGHQPQCRGVSPNIIQLRHVLEIHPVNARDEGKWNKYRRNDREDLHDFIHPRTNARKVDVTNSGDHVPKRLQSLRNLYRMII